MRFIFCDLADAALQQSSYAHGGHAVLHVYCTSQLIVTCCVHHYTVPPYTRMRGMPNMVGTANVRGCVIARTRTIMKSKSVRNKKKCKYATSKYYTCVMMRSESVLKLHMRDESAFPIVSFRFFFLRPQTRLTYQSYCTLSRAQLACTNTTRINSRVINLQSQQQQQQQQQLFVSVSRSRDGVHISTALRDCPQCA